MCLLIFSHSRKHLNRTKTKSNPWSQQSSAFKWDKGSKRSASLLRHFHAARCNIYRQLLLLPVHIFANFSENGANLLRNQPNCLVCRQRCCLISYSVMFSCWFSFHKPLFAASGRTFQPLLTWSQRKQETHQPGNGPSPDFKDKDGCKSPLFNFCLYNFLTLFFGGDWHHTHYWIHSRPQNAQYAHSAPGRLENTHHQSLRELLLFLLACCLLTQRDLGDVSPPYFVTTLQHWPQMCAVYSDLHALTMDVRAEPQLQPWQALIHVPLTDLHITLSAVSTRTREATQFPTEDHFKYAKILISRIQKKLLLWLYGQDCPWNHHNNGKNSF